MTAFDEQELPAAFDGGPYRRYIRVGEHVVPTACSVNEGPLYDSSFMQWGPHVDIVLDGAPQDRVVSFDTESGWLRRHRLNAAGKVYSAGDCVATEVLRGKVELRPK